MHDNLICIVYVYDNYTLRLWDTPTSIAPSEMYIKL